LVNGHRNAGWHTVIWDGHDGMGSPVASGTYFYRLSADGQRDEVRRMTLVK